MGSASTEVVIRTPRDEVHISPTDPSRWAEWGSLRSGWPDEAPTKLMTGSLYRETPTLHGVRDVVDWTVAGAIGPSILELYGVGAYVGNCCFVSALKPQGPQSTRVRFALRNLVRLDSRHEDLGGAGATTQYTHRAARASMNTEGIVR